MSPYAYSALALLALTTSTLATPNLPRQNTALPTTTPSDGLGAIESLFLSPTNLALVDSVLSAVESDAISYIANNPSQVYTELGPLVTLFNPIVSAESYYPVLLSYETQIGQSLGSIVSSDGANPTAVVNDVENMIASLFQDPTFTSLFSAMGTSLPQDGLNYLLSAGPAIIAALPTILADVNPIFAQESFYPQLTSLESEILAAFAGPTPTASVSVGTITSPSINLQTATAGPSITPFKGAAAPGHAVGTVVVGGVLAALGAVVVAL